jgi:hypothetical protein
VTILPSNRDTLPLEDDPPAGGGGARLLRAVGAVAGVAAVLVLGGAAGLPTLVSPPGSPPVASATTDSAPLPLVPPAGLDQDGAPGEGVVPPSPAHEGDAEGGLGGSARVDVRRLPDGGLALRVREASPGTQVWLPGGVRLLITEGDQVRLLDPVPDGVLSPEPAR